MPYDVRDEDELAEVDAALGRRTAEQTGRAPQRTLARASVRPVCGSEESQGSHLAGKFWPIASISSRLLASCFKVAPEHGDQGSLLVRCEPILVADGRLYVRAEIGLPLGRPTARDTWREADEPLDGHT